MADAQFFICYQRDDSPDRAHRLHGALIRHFGPGGVFIGPDVPRAADVEKAGSCRALLVVIGPDWLTDAQGERRPESELAYVRREIAIARQNGIRIVPLCVRGAHIPTAGVLGSDLAWLARLDAQALSDDAHWLDDVNRLVQILRPPWWRAIPAAIWRSIAQHRYVAAGGVAAVVAAVIVILASGPEDHSLRIYSSLPHWAHPTSATDRKHTHYARIFDMERAMQLALDDKHGKAGRFDVTYMRPLNDSEKDGETSTALVRKNAQQTADDPRAAFYIGNFNSGATQDAMPILSHAKIPQISPAATRVGLTVPDPIGDTLEPERYRKGSQNFVRIIPTAASLALALLQQMRRDGCDEAVMINDASPYGTDLANNIRLFNVNIKRFIDYKPIHFVFSQPVDPRGKYTYLLEQVGRIHPRPSCFVYSGTRNANTVDIFNDFANALGPKAHLYGTNGVGDDTFYKGVKDVAKQVTVMLPWHDPKRSTDFVRAFRRDYKHKPDPYAFYGYEAMRVALDAIERSKTGKREDILAALMQNNHTYEDTVIGNYSFTPAGDVKPATAGLSTIAAARRREAPAPAPCDGCDRLIRQVWAASDATSTHSGATP